MTRHIQTIRMTVVFGAVCGLAATVNGSIIPPPAPEGLSSQLSLTGSQGDPVDTSRWTIVEDGQAQYTAWANQRIDFNVSLDQSPSNYLVGVTAKNWTSLELPHNYTQFKVGVSLNDSFVDYLYIDASDDSWSTSWIDVGSLSGASKLTLNWVNDSYSAGHYDANIAIGAVQFATTIPTPATGTLFVASLALASTRRRRN